jgi:hypothetical protein
MPFSRSREFIPYPLNHTTDVAHIIMFAFKPKIAIPTISGIEALNNRTHESDVAEMQLFLTSKITHRKKRKNVGRYSDLNHCFK